MDLDSEKLQLLNVLSASLIQAPNFANPSDPTAITIHKLVEHMSSLDPEFVLKLALYVRDDLNIRSTANYMLALCAHFESCQPFLRKYFDKTIRLPSDWLDVSALYQTLPFRNLSGSAIPTALRKALIEKFPSFDAYQLGKYNREGKVKREAKKAKEKAQKEGADAVIPRKSLTLKQMIRQLHISVPPYYVMCILGKKYPLSKEDYEKSGLTAAFDPEKCGKRMKLPVPETWETLLSARGNSANTWEQLIDHRKLPFMAMLRNLRNMILVGISPKHHKWVLSRLRDENTVINSRQFPFAFFSAYEAIKVDLEQLRVEVDTELARLASSSKGGARGRGGARGAAGGRGSRGAGLGRGRGAGGAASPAPASGENLPYPKKKVKIPKVFPTPDLIKKYRDALDTSVKLATVHNVKPIRGSTVVFCNVSHAMDANCKSARGLGPTRSLSDVGVLLGLMCKYMCEECDFRIFAGSDSESHISVNLEPGTILDNMEIVKQTSERLNKNGSFFPEDYMVGLIRDRKKIDQIIVLSNETVAPGYPSSGNVDIGNILTKYRQEVNKDLLYVSVNLSGRGGVMTNDGKAKHPNDVVIAGFSSSILRYIAERGDGSMLSYIQHIDEIKGLNIKKTRRALSLKERKRMLEPKWESSGLWSWMDPVQVCGHGGCGQKVKKQKLDIHMKNCSYRPVKCKFQGCSATIAHREQDDHFEVCPFNRLKQLSKSRHRTARVFVSSTFLDMHGERDILTKRVFPELRARCLARRVNFFEVDLRWGVTEEEATSGSSLGICLSEVDRCRPFFLGMLGRRYGRVKSSYSITEGSEQGFDWLSDYPPNRSITELEMHYGALMVPESSRALFYLRDDESALAEVDPEYAHLFKYESSESRERVEALRERIREYGRKSGRPCVLDGYTCAWGGVVDSKPVMKGLEKFADRVLRDLWREICDVFPEDNGPPPTPLEIEREPHDEFIQTNSRIYVGRQKEIAELYAFADGKEGDGVCVVHGPAGVGKSAFLSAFCKSYAKDRPGVFLLSHFISASSNSADICNLLKRLCEEIKADRAIREEVTMEYQELQKTFERFLEIASFGRPMVIVLDGLDQLHSGYRAQSLDWLPSNPGVRIILSAETDSAPHRVLQHRNSELPELSLPVLSDTEQKDLVRKRLWEFRKKLDESPSNNQMRMLCSKQVCSSPLWLVIACEELRVFGVFEELSSKIKSLPGSISSLISSVLSRIEKDHGVEAVSSLLCLLYCSNGGLLENEILTLLARQGELALPSPVWFSLYRSLQVFLRPAGDHEDGTYDFFHKSFADVVQTRYMFQRNASMKYHDRLANFYLSQADPNGDGSWKGITHRSVLSLPYHLTQAKMWTELEMVLCDLRFNQIKCEMGLTYDLVRDLYDACSQGPGENWPSGYNQMSDFHHFISSNAHLLAQKPHLLFQQAANSPDSSCVQSAATFFFSDKTKPSVGSWVRWLTKPAKRDPCNLTLTGFHEPFLACDFSPSGDLMVSSSRDRSIKIWEVKSGSELVTLMGHSNAVVDCKFSPDGRRVVSASWDRTLKIWDVETGAEVATLTGHRRRVSACCYSNDGHYVLSASWDCRLCLWDLAIENKPRLLRSFKSHEKPVNACSFSPDDKRIVSASWDSTIIIWDAESASVISKLEGHRNSVRSVAFSPDGNRLVSTSVDCTVRVWDVDTGSVLNVLEGHSSPVNRLSFCADGRHLVSASDDQTIRIWDTVGGRAVRNMQMDMAYALYCEFFPDGNRVVSGQSDCTVVIWDTLVGEKQVTMEGHTRMVNMVRVSPSGKMIASVSDDETIRLWTPFGASLHVLKGHRGAVTSCCFSKNGKQLVTTGEDFTLKVWDTEKGELLATLEGHTDVAKTCAFSPDGNTIVSSSRDNSIRIWDFQKQSCTFVIGGLRDWVNDIAFSPNGRYVVTASWDFNLSVWDMKDKSKKPAKILKGHSGAVASCQFSLDGERIVSSSYDGTIRIWNFASGNEITAISAHDNRISCCQFSRDGLLLVSCAEDRTIRVWDAVAGKEISRLQGHSGGIEAVSYHPDQSSVVSAGQDGTVRVWTVTEGAADLSHKDGVTELVYSPDGRFLISTSRDKSINIWYTVDMIAIATIRGHRKGVNSCAIMDYRPGGATSIEDVIVLVTVSDSGTISVWEVTISRGSSATYTMLAKTDARCPLKSVSCPRLGSEVFYTADWKSQALQWSYKNRSLQVMGTIHRHNDWVNAVCCAPKGGAVASASHDGTVSTGSGAWKVHDNWVLDCAFSPSSKRVASGSYDHSLCIITTQGKTINHFAGHTERVNKVRFLDEDTLLSVSHDRSLKVWEIGSGKMLAEFVGKGPLTALAVSPLNDGHFCIGNSLGSVEFLELVKN